jgi:mannitol-specific phosphotransferase system IIBC component
VYTLLRIVLFVGAFGLVTLLGLRGLTAVLVALLVSAVASIFLLKRQRDAISDAAASRQAGSAAERERQRARLRDEA